MLREANDDTKSRKVFLYTQKFPREYKYTLGQYLKRDAILHARIVNTQAYALHTTDSAPLSYFRTFNLHKLTR